MASEASYLSDFFTPDRLDWYRDLSVRFPLWCGNWPLEQASTPDYDAWERHVRLQEESSTPPGMVLFEPASETVPSPVMFGMKNGEPYISPIESPLLALLLTAIEITPWQDRQEDDRYHPYDTLRLWAKKLDRIILRTSPGNVAFLLDLDEEIKPELTGDLLLHVRHAALAEPRGKEGDRKALLNELQKVWIAVGEAVGIIPSAGTGGPPQSVLPLPFIVELRSELVGDEGLLACLVRFRTSDDDSTWLNGLAGPLEPSEIDSWLRRLHFPMLRLDEIEHVMSSTQGYISEKLESLALDLLAGRLPIKKSTLKNLLSKHTPAQT